jgi:outer membrane protein assembly factor BamB
MKKHLSSLLVLFLFLSTSLVGISTQNEKIIIEKSSSLSNGGLMNSSWPMYLHDARHSGQSPYSPSGNWPFEKWTYEIKSFSVSSPAIDNNGTIYIGSNWEHCLLAINPNGTEKWSATISNTDSSPAIGEDGTIYIGDSSGTLNAINPNGTNKWSIDLGNEIYAAPVIDNNGIIYAAIGSSSDKLCAVYPNGTLKWSFQTEGPMYGAPAVANDGTIYVGSCDGYFYALYPNGTLEWKYYCGDTAYVYGVSISTDGTIYCCGRNMDLYAFYPNGTVKWRVYFGHPSGESNLCVADDGTVYIGCYGLYSISSNGTTNWRFTNAGTVFGAPIVDSKGHIYCASENKHLWVINKNGTLLWDKSITGEGMASSAAIDKDGTIYISGLYFGSTYPYAILYSIGSFNDTRPTAPSITGTENGHVRRMYNYTLQSIDPDNDNISYYIDWGDSTNTGWMGPYASGHEITVNHTWTKRGTYTIKAMAMDYYGAESNWGTLSVTMPLSYEPPHFRFLDWLLERFPHAFLILRFLLDFNH